MTQNVASDGEEKAYTLRCCSARGSRHTWREFTGDSPAEEHANGCAKARAPCPSGKGPPTLMLGHIYEAIVLRRLVHAPPLQSVRHGVRERMRRGPA